MNVRDIETENSAGSIAIIGMNGRFPGAKNTAVFWENLRNGVESVKFFSRDELMAMGIDDYLLDNPRFVAADAILDDMDQFDASFFDYSAREAEIMDPQHRHFLESAWEVLESAGYNSELYPGRIAVYAGSALSGYMIRNINSHPELVQNVGTFKIMIANSQDFLATRVSYKLNLTGPSVNVNTLCSSSMVAIHLGCQNLLNYNCDLAIAGGVSFQISRNEAFFYQEGGIGASDGHCRAFDARANGTVSGSGLGVVVLKRLEDALADGDYIYAVIRGSAVNNDGSSKNSFTAPNVDGQAECIAEAIAISEVDPETISYIEAHGTGTNLGDPIEIAALTKVFRSYTQKKKFCGVGSVKTNIGHLVTAGGIASLIKTVLAMQHHLLPPSLNFETPNPKIDFENSPFYVHTALSKWEGQETPLRAGVSSFGIGGTNVHVILEEAPPALASPRSNRPWQLVVFSAKTQTALDRMTLNLVEYCQNNPDLNLADVAFTLHVGRRSFNYRRMLVCRDLQDLIAKLTSLEPAEVATNFYKPKEPEVVFAFPGASQGYVNMGRELYQTEPVFRTEVDRCFDMLAPLLKLDPSSILYPEPSQTENAGRQFSQPGIQRAVTLAFEYALARLWQELEVEPGLMLGQDVGEYAAACLAGVFSLEDALALVSADEASLQQKVASIALREPKIPFISTVTGTRITGSEATDPDYWLHRLPLAANFQEGLREIGRDADRITVTIGPGQAFHALMKEMFPQTPAPTVIVTQPGGVENRSDQQALFSGIGQFWLAGGQPNWFKLYTAEKRHRIPLPTYPFERQRYWIEPKKQGKATEETELQISNGDDAAKLLNDPGFKAENLSLSLKMNLGENGIGRQLEQALRFRADLESFCKQYSEANGLKVDIPTLGIKVKKPEAVEAAAAFNREPDQPPKKPRPDLATPYTAPRNETERIIVSCWQNVLGFDQIGINDDFFELGGHSLLAAAVANELSRIFQIQVPLRNLFDTSTVTEIAELIETYRWAAKDVPAAQKEGDEEEGVL
jgi:phthiocerol/phenolphthiocerol synthesis type-I polyketide synthase E